MQSQGDMIHYGIYCDVCDEHNIQGVRYNCKECFDYDLCSDCKSEGHHSEHSMRKIKYSQNPFPQSLNFGFQQLQLADMGKSTLNSDGFIAKQSTNGKYYCGRNILSCLCCDGHCGPTNGCNCEACQNIDSDDDDSEDGDGMSFQLASLLSTLGESDDSESDEDDGQAAQDVIHYHIGCNKCKKRDFRGIRYKCLVCADYDLCPDCQAKGHHRQHGMMKITKSKYPPPFGPSAPISSLTPVVCEGKFKYRDICKAFRNTLGIHKKWFESGKNMCYCMPCHSSRGDNAVYCRGQPKMKYALPVGWYRFGLKVSPKVHQLDAFEKWHRGYHGTKANKIVKILEIGDIVPAGMKVRGGDKIKERDGHFNKHKKPKDFNTHQVFVSPSITYAGYETYASSTSFIDPKTETKYKAKIALQVLVEPGTYKIDKETVGAKAQIDPNIDNSELEWSTDQLGAVIIYGLLVKISKK